MVNAVRKSYNSTYYMYHNIVSLFVYNRMTNLLICQEDMKKGHVNANTSGMATLKTTLRKVWMILRNISAYLLMPGNLFTYCSKVIQEEQANSSNLPLPLTGANARIMENKRENDGHNITRNINPLEQTTGGKVLCFCLSTRRNSFMNRMNNLTTAMILVAMAVM